MAKSLLKIFFFAIFFWVSPVAFGATENMNAMDIPGAHESNDKRFDLNLAKGCYIVKVGRTVRKVSIH